MSDPAVTPETKSNGYFTEALLQHLDSCSQCIAAKRTPGMPKCSEGRRLIQETINERHGGIA